MIRTPRSSKDGMNKGAWKAAEDQILRDYIKLRGEGKWSNVAKETGLKRCGKSCRLRWMNYLRPDIKRGNISRDEEELIIRLHKLLGNRWSLIAGRLPGRTDNEIKNYWNSNLAKKLPEPLVQSKNINKMRTRVKFQLPSSSLPPPAPPTPAAGNSVFIGAAAPSDEEDTKELINGVELPLCTEGHRARIDKTAIHETETGWHSFSDGSPSSMSTKEGDNDNSSDFMMLDFNVEDFCNILDCNVEDFTNKFSETEDEASIFPEKIMEENLGGDQSDTTTTTTADQDQFLSLASSFLESAEEWPGDHDFNNNINHVSKSFNLH